MTEEEDKENEYAIKSQISILLNAKNKTKNSEINSEKKSWLKREKNIYQEILYIITCISKFRKHILDFRCSIMKCPAQANLYKIKIFLSLINLQNILNIQIKAIQLVLLIILITKIVNIKKKISKISILKKY